MRSDLAPMGANPGVHTSPGDAPPTFTTDTATVALLRWPEDHHQRAALESRRQPRLLLVADGVSAPVPSDELEDWTRSALGSAEFEARVAELVRRSQPLHDEVRLTGPRLRRGSREVRLTPTQCVAVAPLLRLAGRPVPRKVITDALTIADTAPSTAAVRALLTRLDRLVTPLGLRVWRLSGQAVLLEVVPEVG